MAPHPTPKKSQRRKKKKFGAEILSYSTAGSIGTGVAGIRCCSIHNSSANQSVAGRATSENRRTHLQGQPIIVDSHWKSRLIGCRRVFAVQTYQSWIAVCAALLQHEDRIASTTLYTPLLPPASHSCFAKYGRESHVQQEVFRMVAKFVGDLHRDARRMRCAEGKSGVNSVPYGCTNSNLTRLSESPDWIAHKVSISIVDSELLVKHVGRSLPHTASVNQCAQADAAQASAVLLKSPAAPEAMALVSFWTCIPEADNPEAIPCLSGEGLSPPKCRSSEGDESQWFRAGSKPAAGATKASPRFPEEYRASAGVAGARENRGELRKARASVYEHIANVSSIDEGS
ncbi:hypothetical protein FB451DRAFT_1190651 [Mycena latifolia]|nr:hypothetical protein FB451DRAFT_1190651 [Mycena latifolia]